MQAALKDRIFKVSRELFRGNKTLAAGIVAFLCIGAVYVFGCHPLIRAMYEKRSIEILNTLIARPGINPVEHYFAIADRLFAVFMSVGISVLLIMSNKRSENRLLNGANVFGLPLAFVGTFFVLNVLCNFFNNNIQWFNCPFFWPISIFAPRIFSLGNLFTAIFTLVLFWFFVSRPRCRDYSVWQIMFMGVILILGSNLIQGWSGLIVPIAGGGETGIQYYQDAVKIGSIPSLISNYCNIQPGLVGHAKAHPPGAVLSIYVLYKIFGHIPLIAVGITIISTFLSVFFLYGILKREVGDDLSKYASFLFILIPSVQIYYTATVDALISSCLLGVLYFFTHPRVHIAIIGSVFFAFLASFLTYLWVLIVPVMVAFDVVSNKNVWKSFWVLSALTATYSLMSVYLGFNYIVSFMIASTLENHGGFLLFADPTVYLFSRLESVAEMILFFGPFLGLMLLKGVPQMKRTRPRLFVMFCSAIFTLFGMFLCGVAYTGETARTFLFVYPYLLFPVISFIEEKGFSLSEKHTLLYLVFAQSILMQMFGDYFW